MSTQTPNTTEEIVKSQINDFINTYTTIFANTNTSTNKLAPDDYLTLINGGIINGTQTQGFLALKAFVLKQLKVDNDNISLTLNYVQNYKNNNLQ